MNNDEVQLAKQRNDLDELHHALDKLHILKPFLKGKTRKREIFPYAKNNAYIIETIIYKDVEKQEYIDERFRTVEIQGQANEMYSTNVCKQLRMYCFSLNQERQDSH